MPYNAEQNQQQNQNQDPNEQQGQQQPSVNLAGSGGASPTGGAGSGRVAAFSSGQPQSTGSGRYTNLQKYIGANQGATDRLYQGINNRVEQTAQPKKQEAETQAEKVKQGIEQGGQALQKGTGYYNQMQDQNFNAQNFAADENRLNEYSQFRTGTAIDGTALNNQNSAAQTANMQAQDQYGQRLGQVGNEAGRFDLLKETFGGRNAYRPTYSAGNQRLDQLFLQSGSGDKVGQLQGDIRNNMNSLGRNLSNLQGMTAEQIKNIQDQQTALSGNIQNKANSLETGYIDNIQNQVGGVNAARDAERSRYNNFVSQLLATGQGKETNQALDSQLFDESLLNNGEQTFNFFKNPTLTSEQFQNIDTRNATDYHDIANQQNVDYYNSLSKLAGINNGKLNQAGMLVDPATGQLVRAATLKTGDGSLRQGVTKAQDDFIKYAQNANINGHGEDSGTSGLMGSGGTAEANLNLNLGQYLQNPNNQGNSSVPGVKDTSYSQLGANIAGLGSTVGQFATLANGALSLTGNNPLSQFGNSLVNAPGQVAGQLTSSFGLSGNSGSSVAAAARARQNLLDNLTGTLKDQGYNNYLTKSGVKNTDDLANQAHAIENQRLSDRNDNAYYTTPLNTQADKDAYANTQSGRVLANLLASKNIQGNQQEYNADQVKQMQQQLADNSLSSMSSMGQTVNGKQIYQLTPDERAKFTENFLNNSSGRNDLGDSASSIRNIGTEALNGLLTSRQATEDKYNQQQQATSQALRERLGLPDINLNDFENGLNSPVNTGGTIKGAYLTPEQKQRLLGGK